jgi:hypothetical protein
VNPVEAQTSRPNGAIDRGSERNVGPNDCHKKYDRVFQNTLQNTHSTKHENMLFYFAMHATTTVLLAMTFTIPMHHPTASHQTACRPVWNAAASPCHYQPAAFGGAIGTASFFDEDDLLPEDDFPHPASNDEGKYLCSCCGVPGLGRIDDVLTRIVHVCYLFLLLQLPSSTSSGIKSSPRPRTFMTTRRSLGR